MAFNSPAKRLTESHQEGLYRSGPDAFPYAGAGTETVSRPRVLPLIEEFVRRSFDISISVLALIASMPLMAVLFVVIRLHTPGPAIFKQKRVGKGGKLFTFYKFRTMYHDARERFPELYEYRYSRDEIKSLYFKKDEDPRLTPFGRKLRKTSLDELPNFLNVLRGEMSLVGPRPDIPEMVAYYSRAQLKKLSIKPGLTGYAQVNGRGCLSFQDTLKEDLQYIEDRSLLVDLKVLYKTFQAVFSSDGAF